MDGIRRERRRLLRRAASVSGGSFTVAAFACLLVPSTVDTTTRLLGIPLLAIAGAAIWLATTRVAWLGVVVMVGVVIGAGVAASVGGIDVGMPAETTVPLALLAGGALPGVGIVLLATRRGAVAFVGIGAAIGVSAAVAFRDLPTVVGLIAGWIGTATLGLVIVTAIPPAIEQIADIGRAHRAERQASELEAQRRQGARLLHDTVLATLTLLAHSGIGVNDDVLRAQAASDARLLRQLRLGETPTPTPGTPYQPEAVEETTLAETLDAVRRRFDQLGLDVSLHGAGRVLLPPLVLDAFLLAIAECLENVRRHSGVAVAHVTITEDERAVRAIVTDAGAGFDLGTVEDGRLGLKESVQGRLASVGGSARIFSSIGAGTTVLLEVPR